MKIERKQIQTSNPEISAGEKLISHELGKAQKSAQTIIRRHNILNMLDLTEDADIELITRITTEKVLRNEYFRIDDQINLSDDRINRLPGFSWYSNMLKDKRIRLGLAIEFVSGYNENIIEQKYSELNQSTKAFNIKASINNLFARQFDLNGRALDSEMFLGNDFIKPWADVWRPKIHQ